MDETLLSKILLGQRPPSPEFIERACAVLQLPEDMLFHCAPAVPTGTDVVHTDPSNGE